MLKVGVFGAGHLGKIHIRLLKELSEVFHLVGFYDANEDLSLAVSKEFGVPSFSHPDELIDLVDCIDIVTPTPTHFELASKSIRRSKHVFIEKPITQTVEEAKILLSLAEEADVKIQVGHVERFNPAFQAAQPYFNNPLFIETHRLAQFNPRGTDVPVVLDLMIHDLDIILSVVKSSVRRISASGVAVVSESPDIANARIEFDNGCVANLTSSRISLKNMRKSRFFQKDAYISVDFLTKETEVVQMEDVQGEANPFDLVLEMGEGKPSKRILFEKPSPKENNAIKEELKSFAQALTEGNDIVVTGEDGMKALEIAEEIMQRITSSIHFVNRE